MPFSESKNKSKGLQEWYLLFPEKIKCHSQMTDNSKKTQAKSFGSGICFFLEKQMPFSDDR